VGYLGRWLIDHLSSFLQWITDDNAEKTASGTSMAAPGVNGKLLVALSKCGNMKPADLITQLENHADPVVECTPLGCEAPFNPPIPDLCDLMMTT